MGIFSLKLSDQIAHLRVNMIMGIFSLKLSNQMIFFSLGKMGKRPLLKMGIPIARL